MENPFITIDYERENKIASDSYKKGLQDGALKLSQHLCEMTDEELINWRNSEKQYHQK